MIVHLIKEVGAESGKREVGPLAKVTLFTSLSNLAKLMNIIMELMMMMTMVMMMMMKMMMMKMVMVMVDIMFANDVPSPYWVGDFCADITYHMRKMTIVIQRIDDVDSLRRSNLGKVST